MTTKKDIEDYIRFRKKNEEREDDPIFEIMVFENPDKETVYPTGKHSGFPDIGASCVHGFYYDLDTAIEGMHENVTDLREACYEAGFILCRFQGMAESVGKDARMYFVWDNEKQGYFEKEEPEIFKHIAY